MFTEESFSSGIPHDLMDVVNAIDPEPAHQLFETIFNSKEQRLFVESISLPQFEILEKKSLLVDEAKRMGNSKKTHKEQ